MKFPAYVLTLFFSCIFFFSAFAQVDRQAERAQNRAEQKAQNRVDRKVDDAIDSGLDALEGLFKKKKKSDPAEEDTEVAENNSDEEPSAAADAPVFNDNPVEEERETADWQVVPNPNPCSFTVEVTTFKNGKETKNGKVVMDYTIDRTKTAMKINSDKGQPLVTIIDQEDKSMTTLMDNQQAMKMQIPKMNMTKVDNPEDYTVTKTDEFKTIDNHRCRKYIIENEDYRTESWIAEDFEVVYSALFAGFNYAGNKKSAANQNDRFGDIKGFPLESFTVEKNGKDSYQMNISNIILDDIDRSVFDLSGYKIMEMPGFGN